MISCCFTPDRNQGAELRLASFSDFVFKVTHVLAKRITDTRRSEVWHETPTYVHDLIFYEAPAVTYTHYVSISTS
jgi:hypothetical protein